MIHEVDSALRTLIEREADGMRDVEIVFDAPTREWAGRRNAPTVDVYLYDIREDMRRRERGMHNEYDERKIIVGRHLPPRHFKLSYLVTAWTQRPEDEHRLLSSLLSCFLRYDALPADVLTGPLTDLGLPVPITIALPPPEDRAFADVWSALGGELKPSIDLVVITPLDTGQQFHTGPPVAVPPRVALGGSNGWPTRETKSRDGVEAWPDGMAGPTRAGAASAGTSHARGSADGAGAEDESGAAEGTARSSGGKRSRAGSRGRVTAESRARSSAPGAESSAPGAESSAPGAESSAAPSAWQAATSWAEAMAPLGSEQSTAAIPGRTAGRSSGSGAATGAPASAATPPDESSGSGRTGTAKGRPGPRVAMTRVRQTKKRS